MSTPVDWNPDKKTDGELKENELVGIVGGTVNCRRADETHEEWMDRLVEDGVINEDERW